MLSSRSLEENDVGARDMSTEYSAKKGKGKGVAQWYPISFVTAPVAFIALQTNHRSYCSLAKS